jgi:subtilisin family serine protease
MKRYCRFIVLALLLAALLVPALAPARPAVSPALRNAENGEAISPATVITEIPGQGSYLNLFLEGSVSEAELTARGVLIGSRLPNGVMTAKVPVAAFQEVAALSGMTRITAAYKVKMNLDASTPATLATPNYWALSSPNFTGQAGAGVIVGSVDSGIDWSNGDFQNPDGTTRIRYVWDQNDLVGPNPSGFSYGSEWTQADITAATPRETDADGHGTHVLGIAAGDGSTTGNSQPADRYIGMAPRAEIINVATDFSTTGIVDGVNYIFQKAEALGKNAVVNLSLGSQFGAHDGTETFDASIDALTGVGKIVVVSAGNEGGQSLHAEKLVPPAGGTQTITFSVPAYTANSSAGNDYVIIDAYYPGSASMTVMLTSPSPAVTVGPVSKGFYASNASSAAGNIYIENGYTSAPGGDTNIYIQIYDSNSTRPPRAGTWTITLTPVTTTAATEADFWLADYQLGASGVQPLFTSDVDEHELVASPGSASTVVTVGAYSTKYSWLSTDGNTYHFSGATAVGTLAPFSSPGPLRNGTQKPDITAPGTAIVSTLSGDVSSPITALVVPDGVHWVLQGTSMAAPHVTGGVALLLAATPNLTPAQVKARLYADALVDGYTGTCPNDSWGYGKLQMLSSDSQAPSVTISSPNGGETWAVGSAHDITWTATDDVAVTSITIEYSIDNGSNWLAVASDETNDGVYPWTVPNPPASQALVRVTAYDAASNTGNDISDAAFTIADQTAPTAAVTAPNGGEVWQVGGAEQIIWTASDNVAVTAVDLYYSNDNGANYTPIAAGEANDGTYDWLIPNAPTSQARVRVVAHDAAANTGEDVSDTTFAIESVTGIGDLPPVITRPMVLQNRPNPFNPATTIGFGLPAPGRVTITIYSIRGEAVRRLVDAEYGQGYREVLWDGRTDDGRGVPSGAYFYRFRSGGVTETKRLLIAK